MLRKNQIVPLEITDISHEGSGVGRHEGMAVFVPMTAPGDRIEARIVKTLKRHAFGIAERIVTPSPHRIDNDCPVYRRCGGCGLRHISYEEECRIKRGWVAENLRRIGGLELAPEAMLPSPLTSRYRNKAQCPVRLIDGRARTGFFAPRSHTLIPVEDCKLQPAFFGEIAAAVTGFLDEKGIPPYDEASHTGIVRHLFIRYAEATGQVMVWLSVNAEELPHWRELAERLREVCPGLASFGIDRNRRRTNVILDGDTKTLWGKDSITDTLCGVDLELSPLSFYQVNRQAAQRLFQTALEYADPGPEDILLDLYCGTGAIGLSMAGRAGGLIGVESVPQAVENARRNAALSGIADARFLCADASRAAELLREEGVRPDILILDPPRKGASPEMIAGIGAMAPRKVVYVSCDSATLARDLARLAEQGYHPVKITAADLFPRTANVESCCLLVRS